MLAGGLNDNHFAAQLDQVVRDPAAYPVYGNPDEFFGLTYPTAPESRLRDESAPQNGVVGVQV